MPLHHIPIKTIQRILREEYLKRENWLLNPRFEICEKRTYSSGEKFGDWEATIPSGASLEIQNTESHTGNAVKITVPDGKEVTVYQEVEGAVFKGMAQIPEGALLKYGCWVKTGSNVQVELTIDVHDSGVKHLASSSNLKLPEAERTIIGENQDWEWYEQEYLVHNYDPRARFWRPEVLIKGVGGTGVAYLDSFYARRTAPKRPFNICPIRYGTLTAGTREYLLWADGEGEIEQLIMSADNKAQTIEIMVSGVTLQALKYDGTGFTACSPYIIGEYYGAATGFFDNALYDVTNNRYVMYLKRPLRYASWLRLSIRNPDTVDHNVTVQCSVKRFCG